jgi:hypothetical protein
MFWLRLQGSFPGPLINETLAMVSKTINATTKDVKAMVKKLQRTFPAVDPEVFFR